MQIGYKGSLFVFSSVPVNMFKLSISTANLTLIHWDIKFRVALAFGILTLS